MTTHRLDAQYLAEQLPFKVRASFVPVIQYWQDKAENDDNNFAEAAKKVLGDIKGNTELFEPFEDVTLLDKYEKEIELLFKPLFPDLLQDNEIKGLSLPFRMFFFNPTRRLESIIDRAGENYKISVRETELSNMYIMACVAILNNEYGANINFKRPFFLCIPDEEIGVERFYRAFINADFVHMKRNEKTKPLTDQDIQLLIDNYDDLGLWMEKIPPESYDFEGFSLITLFDVTADEALSGMKNILLETDAFQNISKLKALEGFLRSYFLRGDLNLGIASYDKDAAKVRSLKDHWKCNLADTEAADVDDCYCSHSIQEVLKEGKPFIMSDIRHLDSTGSPLIERMREQGVASFIVYPLEYDGETIGVLELTSATPLALNSVVASNLDEIAPLYTIAMQRAVEERANRLEAIIQEEFTRIHPAVKWKFHEVAENLLANRQSGQHDQIADVVFRDVVPLYGQFDIRGSSTVRNEAIQNDLVRQLNAAEEIMELARRKASLPIYDHLKYRIQEWMADLESGISAGDEVKILEFLKTEIYPVFTHLRTTDVALDKAVDAYSTLLDPKLEVIYDQRRSYEESVTMINETINEVVESHQAKAQAMFPHYFEKYKTDGVDYNVYVGQSISRNEKFDQIHLKNLRLWQLLMSHAVEMRVHELKDSLPTPMDIASLILVHDNPLSIRFRMDEMKFDVDGAYNIRYEIVKKRIDKANIKGTTERLTQPGYLAVVYSHDEEASEYMNYFKYLRSLNMIQGEVENVELQDLQGTHGLRALRVRYNFDLDQMSSQALNEAMKQAYYPG